MKSRIMSIVILLLISVWAVPSRAQLQCSASGYSSPTGITGDANTQTIWVAVFGGNYVAKLNLSCQQLATYPVGREPFGLYDDGTYMWVTNYQDNTVSKLQISTGSVVGTYPVGTHPRGVILWAGSIWVANQGSNNLTKLDPSTGALQATIPVGKAPYSFALGQELWVGNTGDNTIMRLDSSGPVETLSSPSDAQYISIGSDASGNWRLYASCYNGSQVAIYNITTFPASLITTISTSAYGYPTGIIASGTAATYVVTHNGYLLEITAGTPTSWSISKSIQVETSTKHLLTLNGYPTTGWWIDDVDDGKVFLYKF